TFLASPAIKSPPSGKNCTSASHSAERRENVPIIGALLPWPSNETCRLPFFSSSRSLPLILIITLPTASVEPFPSSIGSHPAAAVHVSFRLANGFPSRSLNWITAFVRALLPLLSSLKVIVWWRLLFSTSPTGTILLKK